VRIDGGKGEGRGIQFFSKKSNLWDKTTNAECKKKKNKRPVVRMGNWMRSMFWCWCVGVGVSSVGVWHRRHVVRMETEWALMYLHCLSLLFCTVIMLWCLHSCAYGISPLNLLHEMRKAICPIAAYSPEGAKLARRTQT